MNCAGRPVPRQPACPSARAAASTAIAMKVLAYAYACRAGAARRVPTRSLALAAQASARGSWPATGLLASCRAHVGTSANKVWAFRRFFTGSASRERTAANLRLRTVMCLRTSHWVTSTCGRIREHDVAPRAWAFRPRHYSRLSTLPIKRVHVFRSEALAPSFSATTRSYRLAIVIKRATTKGRALLRSCLAQAQSRELCGVNRYRPLMQCCAAASLAANAIVGSMERVVRSRCRRRA